MKLPDPQVLSHLLELTDARGCTVPYFAIEFNRADVLCYLCAHGLTLDIKDNLQRTLLHYSAWSGKAEVMDALSQQDLSAIDPGALDSYGRTAEQCFQILRHDVDAKMMKAFQQLVAAAGPHEDVTPTS